MTLDSFFNTNSKIKAVLLGLIYLSTLFSMFNVIGNVSFLTLFTGLFCVLVVIEQLYGGVVSTITRNKAIICCLLLIAVAWLSVLWTSREDITISRNYAYTILPVYFICAEMTTIDEKDIDIVDNLIVLSGFLFFVYALFTLGLSGLMSGRFAITEDSDQNAICASLFLIMVVTFKQIQKRIKLSKRIVFQVISFVMTAFLYLLTGSRGGLVALAVWILIISTAEKRGRIVRTVVIALLVLSVVYLIAPMVLPNSVYLRLFTSNSYMTTVLSQKDRVAIWKYCFEALVPGVGFFGYGSGVPPYEIGQHFSRIIRAVHNTYLNMFLEFGFIGLPIFIVMIISFIKRCFNAKNREAVALIIGMLIIAFFLDSFSRTYFWNVLTYCSISIRLASNYEAPALNIATSVKNKT